MTNNLIQEVIKDKVTNYLTIHKITNLWLKLFVYVDTFKSDLWSFTQSQQVVALWYLVHSFNLSKSTMSEQTVMLYQFYNRIS